MIKKKLKKYTKHLLSRIGIYEKLYPLFFYSLRIRTKILNVFHKKFNKTVPILLYHRIASPSDDPIKLCVSPTCFEEHLKLLKQNYRVIPLRELSQKLALGDIHGNEAAITFDDGYRDNLTEALPLLEKYSLPATIFVTTKMLGKKADFCWDKEYQEKDRAFFLNEDEIKLLSDHTLIEIGGHTESHPNLIDLTPGEQRREILENKKILERITGKNIKSFAYPFGGIFNFDSTTQKIVAESGFDFAYSNIQRLAIPSKNCFNIPRINIQENSDKTFSETLQIK